MLPLGDGGGGRIFSFIFAKLLTISQWKRGSENITFLANHRQDIKFCWAFFKRGSESKTADFLALTSTFWHSLDIYNLLSDPRLKKSSKFWSQMEFQWWRHSPPLKWSSKQKKIISYLAGKHFLSPRPALEPFFPSSLRSSGKKLSRVGLGARKLCFPS